MSTKRVLTYVSADGSSLPFTVASGVALGRGFQVAGMPAVASTSVATPFKDGQDLTSLRYDMREVSVPVQIIGTSGADLEGKLDTLARVLDPRKGDGQLRLARYNGSTRSLTCRYVSGLTITEEFSNAAVLNWSAVLVFRATSPFWTDTSTASVTYTAGTPIITPFFPTTTPSSSVINIGASGAIITHSIVNTGDVETWPSYLFSNQTASPVVVNLTTGAFFVVDVSQTDGQAFQVDTGRSFIADVFTGVNYLPSLRPGSTLFPLPPGSSTIQITLANASTLTTAQVVWQDRYLAA